MHGTARQSADGSALPLVLDLDGTLLRTDLLHESVAWLMRHRPAKLAMLPLWLMQGRAHLKQKLAETVALDFSLLPVNAEVETLAREAAAAGRPVHVATASPSAMLGDLKARFPFVADVHGTEGSINRKGAAKAELLTARYPGGFAYVGDSRADVPVWRAAAQAIVFSRDAALAGQAAASGVPTTHITPAATAGLLRKSLRLHQWTKNVLVFVPLVLSGQVMAPGALLATLLAFLGLCLVASGTYVINDLLDLEADRRHWSKKNRPLASGALRIDRGIIAAAVTILLGFACAAFGGLAVLAWTGIYLVLTLSYSLWLKRVALLDCLVLAALYTLRLAIGTAASAALPSPWLFIFSMFVFTSMSFAKRNTELLRAVEQGGAGKTVRGYRLTDQPLVFVVGIAAGISSVLINLLYLVNDPMTKDFFSRPDALWGLPVLVTCFLGRVWLVSQRGELEDDPVIFAIRDGACRLIGALMVVLILVALLG